MYVIILGCGRVGSELAKLLVSESHNVVVIDKQNADFSNLGNDFNGMVVQGNGFNPEVLKNAGIERADVFCALTNVDNINIVSSQVAKKMFGVKNVITRIYDPRKKDIYQKLGLNTISGMTLFASLIRDKLTEPRFSNYLLETSQLGVFKIKVDKNLAGKKVAELNLPHELIVTAIARGRKDLIPDLDTSLELHDVVFTVVSTASLEKINKLYPQKEEKD